MASEACCNAGKPTPHAYAGNGSVQSAGDLPLYVSGSGKKAVVVIYDIFGFCEPPTNGNIRRNCDKLADEGFMAVMPDFFRGNFWPIEKFPPNQEEFQQWWGTFAAYERIEDDVLNRVLPWLREQGVESIGVVGFCWGGLMAITLGKHPHFNGVAEVHGARLTRDHAEQVQCPVALLPANDDPPADDLMEVLATKPFGAKCVHRRFDDMFHGFCAARGDWTVPEQRERAQEAMNIVTDFFKATL